jgi:hypothetical protein
MNNKSKPKPNTLVRIMLDRYGENFLRKLWVISNCFYYANIFILHPKDYFLQPKDYFFAHFAP